MFGKEKCLIGVYFVATATSTILFVVTLATIVQLKAIVHEDSVKGLKETEKLKNDNNALKNDVDELRADINLVRAENVDRLLCGMGVAYPGREVADGNITASSEHHAKHGSQFGRLNMPSTGSNKGAWSAGNNEIGEWIGVDFGMVKKIRGVMTQGRSDYDQWVNSYKISCSNATGKSDIMLGDKVYKGNFDRDTIVTNLFSPSKCCRYVRIYPQTFTRHMSLRMEWLTTCP